MHILVIYFFIFKCVLSSFDMLLFKLTSCRLLGWSALYKILYFIIQSLWRKLWHIFFTIVHQLCVAVPCHILKFWAFLGIMLQVNLIQPKMLYGLVSKISFFLYSFLFFSLLVLFFICYIVWGLMTTRRHQSSNMAPCTHVVS